MKRLVFLFCFTCVFRSLSDAQNLTGTLEIKGVIMDSVKAVPLGYVTIGVRESGKM
jgi:hypothetical protein